MRRRPKSKTEMDKREAVTKTLDEELDSELLEAPGKGWTLPEERTFLSDVGRLWTIWETAEKFSESSGKKASTAMGLLKIQEKARDGVVPLEPGQERPGMVQKPVRMKPGSAKGTRGTSVDTKKDVFLEEVRHRKHGGKSGEERLYLGLRRTWDQAGFTRRKARRNRPKGGGRTSPGLYNSSKERSLHLNYRIE